MSVEVEPFGQHPDGAPVYRYSLHNARGLLLRLIDYGATISELHLPDRAGRPTDVVLGFGSLSAYLESPHYFGCTVGRVANRIARGQFTLDGARYALACNNGPHHLHGGVRGFDKVVWEAEPREGAGKTSVRFRHSSPDGNEGYPGRVEVAVVMTLTDADEVILEYTATTDRPTPINLTNHSYFNLAGEGDILGHELMLAASHYTPVDGTLIPTGEVRPVRGTPYDFTRPTTIGARFDALPGNPRGYDHNLVLDGVGDGLVRRGWARDPSSGRTLELATTEPGVQLYTGNYLDGRSIGKGGRRYPRHAGFTLEAQRFPDAVNHPTFPGTILRPGETYRQTTVYRFAAE